MLVESVFVNSSVLLLVCRGPGPGGLCPGAAGRGQLASLPGPVRPDPAQRGPTLGPTLSERRQEPAEPPKPGGELQPTAVQTDCRVSDTHTFPKRRLTATLRHRARSS